MSSPNPRQWPAETQEVRRISRIEDLTRDTFVREFVRTETPLIIENFLTEEVVRLADPAALARDHGESRLRVMVDMPERFLKEFDKSNYRDMRLDEFVALLSASERTNPCYANQQPIGKFPSLERTVTFDDIVPGLRPKFIWFSSKDANIGLHLDPADGYLAQLHGRKRFFLVPFRQSGKLYPFPEDVTRSVVDLRAFSLSEYPRLADVNPYAGELAPGNLLFIPRYTWHYFWGLTTSVSTSVFHNYDLSPRRIATLLRMYGLRYNLGVLSQLVRHGALRRPYEEPGYGWPPFGFLLWKMLTGQLPKWMADQRAKRELQ